MKGVALGVGLGPQIEDPYAMSIAAIDEAVRNVVAVGADPDRIAILDNFCWPSVDDEITMGTLFAPAKPAAMLRLPSAFRSSAARTRCTINSPIPRPPSDQDSADIAH